MTILEMFEREDIYDILEKTLTEYYKEVWNKDAEATISKKHFCRKYVIYPRLGIIVPLFPKWAVIRRTYVSFDVQGNLPKKLFAWAYITLCFLTLGLLADASLQLKDDTCFNRSMVIIPSNRKIRIYDYGQKYVDSILKVGFNDSYFKNELAIRKENNYDFILGIIDSGERWYREKLLKGRCLVRCAPENYDNYLQETLQNLGQFYKKTATEIDAKIYGEQIENSYKGLISKIEKAKGIKCGDKLRRVLDESVNILKMTGANIPLVLTHGDLQTGNIYLDEEENKVYIIDWETIKKKSIWYDASTVMYSTRRQNKFSDLINNIFSTDSDKIFHFDCDKNRDRKLVAAVLILEEMGFFLDEIEDLPGAMGSEIIERYEHEIDRIDWKKIYG